jgi:hypothetical protein
MRPETHDFLKGWRVSTNGCARPGLRSRYDNQHRSNIHSRRARNFVTPAISSSVGTDCRGRRNPTDVFTEYSLDGVKVSVPRPFERHG